VWDLMLRTVTDKGNPTVELNRAEEKKPNASNRNAMIHYLKGKKN
jgi:hypothetical protein